MVDWTTVLVGLIGAGAGALPPLYLHMNGVGRERSAVRAAILAEVTALIDLIDRRGYLSGMNFELSDEELQSADATQEEVTYFYRVIVPADYNLIYRENASRLGCLKVDEAAEVVKFYQLLQSVVADVTPGGYLHEGTTDLVQIRETIAIFSAAIETGTRLIRASSN